MRWKEPFVANKLQKQTTRRAHKNKHSHLGGGDNLQNYLSTEKGVNVFIFLYLEFGVCSPTESGLWLWEV